MRSFAFVPIAILLLAAVPAAPAAGAPLPPEVETWLRELSVAQGLAFDPDALVARREVVAADGSVTVEQVSREAWLPLLTALLEAPGPTAAPAPPHVVAGTLLHAMVQIGRCEGYADAVVLDGVTTVDGAWDAGFHLTPGLVAGGGSIDTADPDALLVPSAHQDTSVRAVGQIEIAETYLTIFGICLATIGQMLGQGVFWFDPSL